MKYYAVKNERIKKIRYGITLMDERKYERTKEINTCDYETNTCDYEMNKEENDKEGK